MRAQSGATRMQPGDDAPLSFAAAPVDVASSDALSALAEALTDGHKSPAASFNWRRHWYAVAALDALDPDVPNAMTILGQRIAVWLDSGLEWRALRDECPHRLAPLSEGRVAEDGALQCSYHGWRFDGCGACVAVPQDPLRAGAAALRSPRSGAVAYPTREAQGLLFVFPCADADAFEAALLAPLPLIPGLDEEPGPAAAESGAPYVRDLPYGLDTLVENLSDPSHVSWSHHGVIGNRNKLASTAVRVLAQPSFAGFDVITPGEPGKLAPQQHTFEAPNLFKIRQPSVAAGEPVAGFGLGEASGLFIYVTPIEPGITRIVSRLIVPAGLIGLAVRATAAIVPIGHMAMAAVYEGDLILIHRQERMLRERAAAKHRGERAAWRSAYFLATADDIGVAICRRWFENVGGGGPFGNAPLPPGEPNRRVLLDRWQQHAVHCAHCRAAGARAQAAGRSLAVASGIAAAAAVASLVASGGETNSAVLAAAASAPALGAAVQAAKAYDSLLRFKDYVHGRT